MTHPQQTTREVLEQALKTLKANHQWHLDHDDFDGYGESALQETNLKAIAALTIHTPSTTGEAERLYDAIKECLLNHRLQSFMGEDEEHYPLVDHLTHGNSLADGQHEIALICDSIYNTVLKPATPPQVEPAPRPFLEINYPQAREHNHEYHYFGTTQSHRRCRHCNEPEPAPSTAGERDNKTEMLAKLTAWLDSLGGKLHTYSLRGIALAGFEEGWSAALMQSTALPVGELTDEQIEEVAKPFVRALGGDHWYSGEDGIPDNGRLEDFARAILAAASSQPVREPLTDAAL